MQAKRGGDKDRTGGSTKKIGKFSSAFEKADTQKCRLSLRRDEFSFPPWQLVPTAVLDGAVTLKGSLNGRFFLKICMPHSLMTTYRMNLISAGSISLDSTFNKII
jgi:hypothetical protein